MNYINFNANPKNRKTGDCVIRAISLALNKSWADTYREMTEHCIPKGYMLNYKDGYKSYLKKLGYEMLKMPKRFDNTRYTVKEFADELAEENSIYILSIANHVTVIKNKDLYDIWDCSKKSVGNYWKIK